MFPWRNKKDISIFQMKKVPYLLLWHMEPLRPPFKSGHLQGGLKFNIALDKVFFSTIKNIMQIPPLIWSYVEYQENPIWDLQRLVLIAVLLLNVLIVEFHCIHINLGRSLNFKHVKC